MQQDNPKEHLSLIPTQWTLVYLAHHGPAAEANSARRGLLERYGAAVRRYLGKVLQNPDAVDEVCQEFAVLLFQGDLRGADRQRGRFRNFVKGTLFHLIGKYRKRRERWPLPLPGDGAALAAPVEEIDFDRSFVESWCDELLARAWAGLAVIESRTGQPYHAVLRFRADHPELHSPQLAEQLTIRLGRVFTAAGVRQVLHRARVKFAALLLEEVAHSLENPTPEQLAEELAELGLLDYCRPALERRDAVTGTA